MTSPTRGAFTLRDWLQLLLAMAGVVSVVGTALGWVFVTATAWKDVPERLRALESRIAALPGAALPEVVEFRGSGIVSASSVKAGGRITITYVLRRSIDCATDIRVRFFDHGANVLSSVTYVIPAVRSPVSSSFLAFPIQVAIPRELPAGLYSYFPEILPQSCGVYGPMMPPMSEAFEVTE